jgi:hypothetical protein
MLHPSWRSSQNYWSTVTSGPWLVSSPASQAEMRLWGRLGRRFDSEGQTEGLPA